MSKVGILLVGACAFGWAGEGTAVERQTVKYAVLGMFSPDRQDDLRETVKKIPEAEVEAIDYETAEVTFSYNPGAALFKNAKPAQLLERFDAQLRNHSRGTFGAKALNGKRDELMKIEIPIAGLDCKGCALGTYWTVYKIEGVDHATVSYKEGWLKAAIDPAKTSREALVAALKKKEGIVVKDK